MLKRHKNVQNSVMCIKGFTFQLKSDSIHSVCLCFRFVSTCKYSTWSFILRFLELLSPCPSFTAMTAEHWLTFKIKFLQEFD